MNYNQLNPAFQHANAVDTNTLKLFNRKSLIVGNEEDKIKLLDSKKIKIRGGIRIVDFVNKVLIENDIDTIDILISEDMLSSGLDYVLSFCLICRFCHINVIKYFFAKHKKQLIVGYLNRLRNYESPTGPYTIVSERVDDNVEIVDFIINCAGNFGINDYSLACMLRSAALCGNFDTFKYLYPKSVTFNNVFAKNTFLYYFWENGIVEIIEYLIVNQYNKMDEVMEMISIVPVGSNIYGLIMELITSGHLHFTKEQMDLIELKLIRN
jgi:hypothetical protein